MTRVYYRDSHGAIIVYDCKRNETLKGACRWKKDLDSKLILDNGQPIPSILVANKFQCDLENDLTVHSLSEYAKHAGFQASFKISAKTGDGVDEALNFLIRKVIDAERDGLYMMPVFQRDHDIRRLSINETGTKKRFSVVKNVCC